MRPIASISSMRIGYTACCRLLQQQTGWHTIHTHDACVHASASGPGSSMLLACWKPTLLLRCNSLRLDTYLVDTSCACCCRADHASYACMRANKRRRTYIDGLWMHTHNNKNDKIIKKKRWGWWDKGGRGSQSQATRG